MSTSVVEAPPMARDALHDLRPAIPDGKPGRKFSLRINPRHLLLVTQVRFRLGETAPDHELPHTRRVFEEALEYYASAILGADHVASIIQLDDEELAA